ncbi:TATA box-binding protein-associated factor RNA polymerase I subunit B-like protein [Drosera capensis]
MVILWFRYLRSKIPLSTSLAVSYLACHIAREPILPTSIQRWIMEGKLSYFSAFKRKLKRPLDALEECPLTASYMFRPSHPVSLMKLESMAGSIAECIGLNLPPVNFHAIASRYLRRLSLPVEKILPYAVRIFEWTMPPDLWLSANEFRLPSRIESFSLKHQSDAEPDSQDLGDLDDLDEEGGSTPPIHKFKSEATMPRTSRVISNIVEMPSSLV